MNKYSLQFKSRECEIAFSESQAVESKIVQSAGLIANALQFFVLLVFVLVKGFQDAGKFSYNTNLAALPLSFFVLACAAQWLKVLLKAQSRFLNIARLVKNVIACVILAVSEQYAVSFDQGVDTTDTFQPLLGFLLTIELLSSLQSTNFLFKIISTVFNITFYTITFWGRSSIAISVAMSIGMTFVLVREYFEDKQRRNLFLDKQKSTELTFLIDKLLPINIVVMKYNPKEERSFLHQVNRKAEHSFNITDNDSFKAFSKRIIIKTDSNDPENDSELDFIEAAAAAAADQSIVSPPHPMLMPSMMVMMQAPSLMNLNPQDMNSQQGGRAFKQPQQQQQFASAGQSRQPHQRSLFFYMESIAKDTYDRRKKELTTNEKQQKLGVNRNNGSFNNDHLAAGTGRITSTQRKKKESVAFDRLLRGSDDRMPMTYNNGAPVLEPPRDFASIEKVNSLESPKKGESIVLSHDRRSKKDSWIDRQKINSIDHRPKGFSVEKTALANSVERERERERQQRKTSNAAAAADHFDRNNSNHNNNNNNTTSANNNNNNNNNSNSNNNKRIAFDRVSGVARRTHTVKIDSMTSIPNVGATRFGNGAAGAGTTTATQPVMGAGSSQGGGASGPTQIRRQRRKSTVMRKMPNFNLNPGLAGAKTKYVEDVYDRIDVLMGEYVDSEGRRRQVSIKIYTYSVNEQYQVILFEDETLESQVKFLKEHNSFLYTSFSECLEEFRLPLAYSLLKLNAAFEEQQRASLAAAAAEDAMRTSSIIINAHTNVPQTLTNIKTNITTIPTATTVPAAPTYDGIKQSSMIIMHQQTTTDASLLNISPNSRKNIYPQSNQVLFSNSSHQHLNFNNTASTKQNVDLFTNQIDGEEQQQQPDNRNQPHDGNDNHNADEDLIGDSMSSSSQNFISPLLMMESTLQQQQQQSYQQFEKRTKDSAASSLDSLGVAVDNSRYYGFLTLNAVYNYIDYISLLQRKQLEVKVTELSMKRIVADVVSLLENQGKKKSVRIIVLNELRYDRISSDERRLKQLLLNFLIPMLSKTRRGYLAIRLSLNAKQYESIKVSITSSARNAYPPIPKAKLRLNSFDDVVSARKNRAALASTVSTAIVGRIGPYSKVSLKHDKAKGTAAAADNATNSVGTCISFSIYQDLNILASVNRFGSMEDNDLLYDRTGVTSALGIAGFKSNVNVHQEGEISELSSCDINYTVNKIIVENLNLTTRVFFPHPMNAAATASAHATPLLLNEFASQSAADRDDFTSVHQLSSKKHAISPSKQYSLYSDSHHERIRDSHYGVATPGSGSAAAAIALNNYYCNNNGGGTTIDYQQRSRSASSRSSDHPAYRFDGSRGVRSQNYRIPSSEEVLSHQQYAATAIATGISNAQTNTLLLQPQSNEYHQYYEESKSRKSTSKSHLHFHDPIIIEDASSYGSSPCGSERQRRSISKARHHSEYIPQNSPSIFSRTKEHYQTVLSFPKEHHALTATGIHAAPNSNTTIQSSNNNNNNNNNNSNSNNVTMPLKQQKRDIKTLKISKKTTNNTSSQPSGVNNNNNNNPAESMSQLMLLHYDDTENINNYNNNINHNSDDGQSGGSHSATLLQVKRVSKTSASSLKIIRSNGQGDPISIASAQELHQHQHIEDSHSNRHKDCGLIKLQLVDLSDNPGDISKTNSNVTSLTHILP